MSTFSAFLWDKKKERKRRRRIALNKHFLKTRICEFKSFKKTSCK